MNLFNSNFSQKSQSECKLKNLTLSFVDEKLEIHYKKNINK